VAALGLGELERRVPPHTVRVHDPYEDREIAFRALAFDQVLDAVYSPDWREAEELLFTCRDGYQPTLPVQRAIRHTAWLAFERPDEDFALHKLESGERRDVPLAPYYLVWENLDDPAIRYDGDLGWPYQLVGIDLIRVADRFPKLTPPADASAEAHAGFTAFRLYCSRCHAVNGEGGTLGPELNTPVSPVEYRDRAWLRRWIDDPGAVLPNARMPRLNPALANRDAVIDEIIAYLEAMARSRRGAGVEDGQ
jgi:cytochrome c2